MIHSDSIGHQSQRNRYDDTPRLSGFSHVRALSLLLQAVLQYAPCSATVPFRHHHMCHTWAATPDSPRDSSCIANEGQVPRSQHGGAHRVERCVQPRYRRAPVLRSQQEASTDAVVLPPHSRRSQLDGSFRRSVRRQAQHRQERANSRDAWGSTPRAAWQRQPAPVYPNSKASANAARSGWGARFHASAMHD